MAELIRGIQAARVRRNLEAVRERTGDDVEILVATKYVDVADMGELAEAGVALVGENHLQDLEEKRERWDDAFEWDFSGALQSRKVRAIAPLVRMIHSLGSDSALSQLGRLEDTVPEVLVQVNVAGEEGKAGISPSELAGFIERCPVALSGLMTMPPFADDPEASRPHFARLAELAGEH